MVGGQTCPSVPLVSSSRRFRQGQRRQRHGGVGRPTILSAVEADSGSSTRTSWPRRSLIAGSTFPLYAVGTGRNTRAPHTTVTMARPIPPCPGPTEATLVGPSPGPAARMLAASDEPPASHHHAAAAVRTSAFSIVSAGGAASVLRPHVRRGRHTSVPPRGTTVSACHPILF